MKATDFARRLGRLMARYVGKTNAGHDLLELVSAFTEGFQDETPWNRWYHRLTLPLSPIGAFDTNAKTEMNPTLEASQQLHLDLFGNRLQVASSSEVEWDRMIQVTVTPEGDLQLGLPKHPYGFDYWIMKPHAVPFHR